jgi:hypothetical protein
MRIDIRNSILTAASALGLLIACPTLQANTTLVLTGNTNWTYTDVRGDSVSAGPYLATLGVTPNVLVYCLDLHMTTIVGQTYNGNVTTLAALAAQPTPPANLAQEEEAAFLASYSLYLGAPSAGLINSVEGPISMAIWQLMGTLAPTQTDPAAAPFIQLAQYAYTHHLITTSFLSSVQVWTPAVAGTSQSFLTAVRDDNMIRSAVPEPGTVVFLSTGVLLMLVGKLRRRK